MALVNKDTLKSWFLRGMKPLSGQFADWLDSYWHKHEKISISSIDKLETILSCKAENNDMQVHRQDNRNPHRVDKAQVGLGNADNTADRDKPVSTAVQAAINEVQTNLDNHNEDETAHADIRELVENTKTADTGECRVTFTEATKKTSLVSGETHADLFGKIQKWLADLKAVAFSGKASDLTEDATHRFTTDAEKANWADKYTVAQTNEKDATTLQAAKEHTAQKIAEIVNGSPEALDTLWELAKALGNDPNFATTVMNAIGTKADKTTIASIQTALDRKADSTHNHTIANVTNLQNELNGKAAKNGNMTESFTASAFFANKMNLSFNRPPSSGIEMLSSIADGVEGSFNKYSSALSILSSYVGFQLGTYGGATEDLRFRKRSDSTTNAWTTWREIWHAGNFSPDEKLNVGGGTLTGVLNIKPTHTSGIQTGMILYDAGTGRSEGLKIIWSSTDFPENGSIVAYNDGMYFASIGKFYANGKEIATIDQLNQKADSGHNHTGVYAPVHEHPYAPTSHTHNYEPVFSKNTAFNKNFGTTAGTVAQGNHAHPNNILCTGKVSADGKTVLITSGFEIVRISQGIYKITHALGHTNYGFIGTGFNSSQNAPTFIGMRTCAATYCEVCSYWGANGFQDSDFSFTIFKQ